MYNFITPLFNWIEGIVKFINNLISTVTKEKIEAGLRKIEENNKHLSEMEVIKLKQNFLDEIDKILDAKIEKIDIENDRTIKRFERQYF